MSNDSGESDGNDKLPGKATNGATNGEELLLLKKAMKCIIGKIGCQLLTIPYTL